MKWNGARRTSATDPEEQGRGVAAVIMGVVPTITPIRPWNRNRNCWVHDSDELVKNHFLQTTRVHLIFERRANRFLDTSPIGLMSLSRCRLLYALIPQRRGNDLVLPQ